jgi:hypothetical protein
MHPDRMAMLAWTNNSPTQKRKTTFGLSKPATPPSPPRAPTWTPTAIAPRPKHPLPSDEADARKKRINANLIAAMKRPCPPDIDPSIQGIGLYTHIAGPVRASPDPQGKDLQSEPEFLPFTKPAGSRALGPQMSEDFLKVWEELRDAVEEEETIIGKTELGLKELKKRYGGLDVPDTSKPRPRFPLRRRRAAMLDGDEARNGTIAASGNTNSVADEQHSSPSAVTATLAAKSRDVAMRGTEVERGRTTEVTSTTIAKFYAPDPRNRGR